MLVARISNPYGPGQDYHKGVGFIDAAIKRTLKHETIEIWGDGNIVRDYIFIDDQHPAKKRELGTHIGNAVPVLLAEKIATALLEVW